MWLELANDRRRSIDEVPVFYKAKRVQKVAVKDFRPDADLIVVGRRATKKSVPRVIVYIPRYPVFVDTDTLLLTPIQAKSLGVGITDDCAYLIGRIAVIYGIIINCSTDGSRAFVLQRPSPARAVMTKNFYNLPFVSKVDLDIWYAPKNPFGWFADQNKEILTTVIRKEAPKVIVELGTWLGRSAKHIRKEACPSTVLICVDKFSSPFVSAYSSAKYHPIDKFYYNFMRFETFHRNLYTDSTVNTYAVRYDCQEAVSLLKRNGVEVSLFYIDFQKKTEPLKQLLADIGTAYPRATVVGDDAVFQSVRAAVESLKGAQLFRSCYVYNSSRRISTPKSDRKRRLIEDVVRTLECDEDSRKYLYEAAVQVLETRRAQDFVALIQKYRLRMNVPVNKLHMHNSLWHVYYLVMKKRRQRLPHIEAALSKYEPVKPEVKNLCCLSAYDYRDHDLVLD